VSWVDVSDAKAREGLRNCNAIIFTIHFPAGGCGLAFWAKQARHLRTIYSELHPQRSVPLVVVHNWEEAARAESGGDRRTARVANGGAGGGGGGRVAGAGAGAVLPDFVRKLGMDKIHGLDLERINVVSVCPGAADHGADGADGGAVDAGPSHALLSQTIAWLARRTE